MNTVLLSLHPVWWSLILEGRKTLEIRKTVPCNCKWPVRVIVYLTAPISAVAGEFLSAGYIKTNLYRNLSQNSCVPISDLYSYGSGKALCGWDVSCPMPYAKKVSLNQLGIQRPPQSWQYCEVPEQWP